MSSNGVFHGIPRALESRVAVVTGSSQGIGRAVALALAVRGAYVVLNGRNEDAVRAVAERIRADGGSATFVTGSVSGEGTAQALIDEADKRYGAIDFVVNNVGISTSYGPLLEAEPGSFAKTMLGNTWPAVDLTQRAVRGGLGQRPGAAVLNISTIGAQQVQPFAGVYGASKAALDMLTRVMARELAGRSIRVNAIAPGLVRSRTSSVMWQGNLAEQEQRLIPLGRLGEPEDIAKAAVFLLSEDACWITGNVLVADGGRMLVGDEPAPELTALLAGDRRPSTDRTGPS